MGFLLLLKTKILSFFIRNINGDVSDNTSKFYQINKVWRNIKLDKIAIRQGIIDFVQYMDKKPS